ncbi:MAG: transcription factor FapR [Clostridia bacterium]
MITKATKHKRQRHDRLIRMISNEPFLTDEQIAERLSVSIPTVRLDRIDLGIKELRERIRDIADSTQKKVKSLGNKDIVGSLLEVSLNQRGMAILETTKDMTFEKTDVVRGEFIYSFAESTAISIIDANAALVGVANIKYKVPVRPDEKLIAKAEVKKIRNMNFITWVMVYRNDTEVFKGKFILTGI